MNEYSDQIEIEAPAQLVYEFVSNAENMPGFLPSARGVRTADAQARNSDEVEVQGPGSAMGARYHLDPDECAMHWSADDRDRYQGQLQVIGDSNRCQIAVKLSFSDQEVSRLEGGHGRNIRSDLRKALETIKSQCESGAPKVRAANEDLGYLG